jgi:tetratricopeptide (TPR) repeat protein
MPRTVNGIGTHYYGRKNVQTRTGVCQHCHREVTLSSYDTRLWVVVIFLPVIPLARKRIIDRCSACSWHYAMEQDRWEAAKQLEISGALEKFREQPTPEAAIEVHARLLQFHQYAQADEIRGQLAEKYADNAKVQVHLAGALAHLGRHAEAEPYFTRALALRPDLPEARVGVAQGLIRAGRLDEARKLLDFLEKPGAVQLYSLGPLEKLGDAYQKAGQHREALQIYSKVLEAIPAAGQHVGFRKRVGQSEKALGQRESMLPKKKFSWRSFLGSGRGRSAGGLRITWRGLAIAGIMGAVVLVGLMIANEYTRHHRKLFVVADFKDPVTVEVPGVGSTKLRRGMSELHLAEGRYHARVTGPIHEDVDFEIHSDYFSRWFSDPAWVLNAGGSAILAYQTAVYSKNPQPSTYEFHYGKSFEFFPQVSHPFQPLPQTLSVNEGESRTLTHLDLLKFEPVDLFFYFINERQFEQALQFGEARLRVRPDDEALLATYVQWATQQKQRDRLEKFIRTQLTARPVLIQWHRAYQNLLRSDRRGDELVTQYDAMVAAEPTNSSLLYLRGRVSATRAEGRGWFKRAHEADPNDPFPLYAMAYDLVSSGNWAEARPLLERTIELRPDSADFSGALFVCRLALGEYGDLEKDFRETLKKKPGDYVGSFRLTDVLAVQRKTSEAGQVMAAFQRALPSANKDSAEAAALAKQHLLYATGDFADLEKQARGDNSAAGSNALFYSLIEQGRLAEAVQVHPLDEPGVRDPFHPLAVAIAWRLAGDQARADAWQARALKLFGSGDSDEVRCSALFSRDTPPTDGDLGEIGLAPRAKAILLVALAQQYPARQAEFATAARKLNVEPDYPYYLLQRATIPH